MREESQQLQKKEQVSSGGNTCGRLMKLITHLYPFWKLTINEAVQPLPHMPLWCARGQVYHYLSLKLLTPNYTYYIQYSLQTHNSTTQNNTLWEFLKCSLHVMSLGLPNQRVLDRIQIQRK